MTRIDFYHYAEDKHRFACRLATTAYERSSRATQEQLARSLTSLKDALELLNVSMEQGNALYRNIVKKLFDERTESVPHRSESIRVA